MLATSRASEKATHVGSTGLQRPIGLVVARFVARLWPGCGPVAWASALAYPPTTVKYLPHSQFSPASV